MTTLYLMPGSCALSCHVALEWAGAAHRVEVLDHDAVHGEAFLAVNPKGKVPALRLDDGTIVTEALAILAWIAETHAPDLLGATPTERASVLETLSELTGEMHPAFAPLHVPGRYVADEGAEESVKAQAVQRVRRHYDRWNERMEDRAWVVGKGRGRRSVADAYLFAMCRWTNMVDADLDGWPALAAFAARMRADNGVRRALDAEGVE